MKKVIEGKLNPELRLNIEDSLFLAGTDIKQLPNNLKVGGYLNLRYTQIKELPENLTVGGSLDLRNTQIKKLPDNLTVGVYLDLRNTQIKELPENLKVGVNLDLEGTNIKNYPVVYNAGDENRAIYLDLQDKSKIHIGCFKGTKEEAIRVIKQKYTGIEATKYIEKVEECFQMWEDMKVKMERSK